MSAKREPDADCLVEAARARFPSYRAIRQNKPETTIALLPLSQIDTVGGKFFLSDAIVDELLTRLAGISASTGKHKKPLLLRRSVSHRSARHALTNLFTLRSDQLAPEAVLLALGRALFSLGVGARLIIILGSFLSEDESIGSNASVTARGADTLVALVAGLMIFPIVLHSALEIETLHCYLRSWPGSVAAGSSRLTALGACSIGWSVVSSRHWVL